MVNHWRYSCLLQGSSLHHSRHCFPAPDLWPRVLRNVTIKYMEIGRLQVGRFLRTFIVLLRGVDIALLVDAVYPQLLVYHGPVPDDESVRAGVLLEEDDDDNLPDHTPLPNPLLANAFAHTRPGQWLDSLSVPLGHRDGEGSIFAVSATIIDISLEVLPGRQQEFSNFLGKVCFVSIKSSRLR